MHRKASWAALLCLILCKDAMDCDFMPMVERVILAIGMWLIVDSALTASEQRARYKQNVPVAHMMESAELIKKANDAHQLML